MSLNVVNQAMRVASPMTGNHVLVFRDRANYAEDASAYLAWRLAPINFSAIIQVHLLAMDARRRVNPQVESRLLIEDRVGGDTDAGASGWQQQRLSWKLGTAFKQLPVSLRVRIEGDNVPPTARISIRLRRGRFPDMQEIRG